jgi:hypothetical protein
MVHNSYLPWSPRSAIGKFGKIPDFSGNRRRSKRAAPKGILIENLPAKHCPHCNEYYFDHETVGLIEEIVKNPKRYAQKLKRPVARVA